jgi:membrane-bound lytic murein transglycosylase C
MTFGTVCAESFDDFKKQNMGGFDSSKSEFSSYKRDIEKSFETYKKIVEEEFQAYKENISKNWDDVEVSTPHKWVEYLNRYRARKTVDYEKGEIIVDVIGAASKDDVTPLVKDLLLEDAATAFRRDPVAFNTEKRLRQAEPDAATSKVSPAQVVSGLFSDKKLNNNTAQNLAQKLINNSIVSSKPSKKAGQNVLSVSIKLPKDRYKKAAEKVLPFVKRYSGEYKIDKSLIMSVIYNESRFNPMAKSYVPAYGLMQIVPKSAGIDAIKLIEGRKRILSPSYLYNPENNVKVGSAYLHILYYRYFKDVKDPLSRLYCSVAAYNTGAGNVAYAFNVSSSAGRYNLRKALPKINAVSPSEVYKTLRRNLRYDEAKHYLKNVTGKMKDY